MFESDPLHEVFVSGRALRRAVKNTFSEAPSGAVDSRTICVNTDGQRSVYLVS